MAFVADLIGFPADQKVGILRRFGQLAEAGIAQLVERLIRNQ